MRMRTRLEIITALERGFTSSPPRHINRSAQMYADGCDAGMKVALAWVLGMSHDQASEISAESWAAWKESYAAKTSETVSTS